MCWYLNDVTLRYYSKYMFMGGGGGTFIYMLDSDIIQMKGTIRDAIIVLEY